MKRGYISSISSSSPLAASSRWVSVVVMPPATRRWLIPWIVSAPAASRKSWAISGCPSCMACIAKAVYFKRALASPVMACWRFVSVLFIIFLLFSIFNEIITTSSICLLCPSDCKEGIPRYSLLFRPSNSHSAIHSEAGLARSQGIEDHNHVKGFLYERARRRANEAEGGENHGNS